MKFQSTPRTDSNTLPTSTRKIDIILLTDNRDNSHERLDYRCSAFKETQADPLEDRHKETSGLTDSLEDLLKRVVRLQEKVEELYSLEEGVQGHSEGRGKKLRRRFNQMERNFQCLLCNRRYGSETSLKCHQKLKHPSQNSE